MVHRMIFRILLFLPLLLLSACGYKQPAPSHTELESSAGEAVLRYVLDHCPRKTEAKQIVIVLGESMDAATPAFEKKFADTGLVVTPFHRMEAGMANGKTRTYDGVTQEPAIVLQLSSLAAVDGNSADFQAVAAWAWKDEAKRFHYKVRTLPDGTFEIQQEGEIPVPPRNQDGIRDPQ